MTQNNVQLQNGNGPLAGLRNQLINGGFRLWEYGTSVSITGSSHIYAANRWDMSTLATNTSTGSRSTANLPDGADYALINNGPDNFSIQQGIELPAAGEVGPFYVGSTWTLSFWATEDYTLKTTNLRFKTSLTTADRQAADPVSYQNTGLTSGSFTKYSATVVIDGTPVSSDVALVPVISLLSGTSITMIQFEPGPIHTPFEIRPIGLEKLLAARYYQTVSSMRLYSVADVTSRFYKSPRAVPMRVDPTETGSPTTGTLALSGTSDSFNLTTTGVASTNGVTINNYTADAEF